MKTISIIICIFLIFGILSVSAADDLTARVTALEQIVANQDARIKILEAKLNITELPVDKCLNINCTPSTSTCPDGFISTCQNTCTNGICSACTPDCSLHQDKCANITCKDSLLKCPDGFNATCKNSCALGICSICSPSCTGHEENNSKPIIIFQCDDIQAWWRESESSKIIDMHIQKNMPVTLAVIAQDLNTRTSDPASITNKLKNVSRNSLIDIGVHGYDHTDYSTLSLTAATNDAVNAKAVFTGLGINTTTFIPPYGWTSPNIPTVMNSAGFVVGTAALDYPYTKPATLLILTNGYIYKNSNFKTLDPNSVMGLVDTAAKASDYVILQYHQQDLTTSGMTSMANLMDKLKASNKYRFMNARQYYEYKKK